MHAFLEPPGDTVYPALVCCSVTCFVDCYDFGAVGQPEKRASRNKIKVVISTRILAGSGIPQSIY